MAPPAIWGFTATRSRWSSRPSTDRQFLVVFIDAGGARPPGKQRDASQTAKAARILEECASSRAVGFIVCAARLGVPATRANDF